MKRKDRDRDRKRGMDRNSDIDRGKNNDMVDTVCMVSFRYFSLMDSRQPTHKPVLSRANISFNKT